MNRVPASVGFAEAMNSAGAVPHRDSVGVGFVVGSDVVGTGVGTRVNGGGSLVGSGVGARVVGNGLVPLGLGDSPPLGSGECDEGSSVGIAVGSNVGESVGACVTGRDPFTPESLKIDG